MRVRPRIFSALVMILVLLLSTSLSVAAQANSLPENSTAAFTGIEFVSNIETTGVAVSGAGLPSTAGLSYRKSGESTWHAGHQLLRTSDGRLIGSLFNLLPATSYDVRVFDGASEINGSVSTQPDQLSFSPSLSLYVDDNALPGGNGSIAAPFQTIQEAVNQAGPGTQVLVADGIYREAVTFPASGTAGNWIQVKAAGNAAILDGADRLSGAVWTVESTAHIWSTKINGPVAYLARDGKRFYQYDDRTGLMESRGHGGVTMNEGWYYEPSTLRLYIRSLDDPANHIWQVPRLNHAFDLAAQDWIWIEGFETRFYGTTTNGCGVCTLNASHIVIRRNKIHNMQLGIFINWNGTSAQGNDTRIEQNEVYDPLVNEWPWAAVKGSFMEGTGIIIRGHIGAIVRDNNVHNFFNGIYTGSSGALENSELAFDADIYNNHIHDISDDGLEPEGACINQRFRNNTVDRSYVGISLAPVTQGPTWVLRSTFTNFTGRGIKFANNSDGIVLIYQNTGWTNAANINGADLITAVHNVVMRNNIFQTAAYSFAGGPAGSTANDWNHDNWYTMRGAAGPHFKWENVNYNTISALCAAKGLECNGSEDLPGLTNPTGGDFTLRSSSPNIDRGVVIPGINDDFIGNGPDIGAYEFGFDLPPKVLSSVRANSNPTHAANIDFTVTFSEAVTGVDTTVPFNDFALAATGITGATITGVSGSGATYIITVNTGTGDGSARLDVVDGNTIVDATGNPLGGVNVGDGDFTSGEVYTIIKSSIFDDVPSWQPYASSIGILYANGYTAGCSTDPPLFCPDASMSRAQAAVFMLRGNYGSGYTPPAVQHIFADDWTRSPWGESWAEGMYAVGLTAGCSSSPLKFCPEDILTNVQAAVFGLRLKYGNGYVPPAGTGTVFADMTDASFWGTSWAEQAYADGLIPACGTSDGKPLFCPNAWVSRGFGASIIVKAKNLTMP